MGDGCVAQFGNPYELLCDTEGGILTDLVEETGPASRDRLFEMARWGQTGFIEYKCTVCTAAGWPTLPSSTRRATTRPWCDQIPCSVEIKYKYKVFFSLRSGSYNPYIKGLSEVYKVENWAERRPLAVCIEQSRIKIKSWCERLKYMEFIITFLTLKCLSRLKKLTVLLKHQIKYPCVIPQSSQFLQVLDPPKTPSHQIKLCHTQRIIIMTKMLSFILDHKLILRRRRWNRWRTAPTWI